MFWKQQKISTDSKKIQEILTRGVEDVFVKESLEKRLLSGKQLTIKLGFDPTGPHIHIGRAIVLWKLRAFQELGHKIVFIVGDFTAKIGDPSDKLEKRPMLTDADIKKNLLKYKDEVGKILDLSKASFVYNSTWLKKLTFADTVELAESFSVQQMSNRRNFKERFEKGDEVSLREFLYPLMQGYDSVMVKADVELGGFDQLFNLKAGRIIQRHYKQPEQDVLTTKMLPGTDGRKMSTSWGNVINIVDKPEDMFGKVMSLRDDLISQYFLLCTREPLDYVNGISGRLEKGENPRDLKIELGKKIVELYWNKEKAEKAAQKFIDTFSKKEIPQLEAIQVSVSTPLVDVLMKEKIVSSRAEFKRLVEEKAITELESGEVVADYGHTLSKEGTWRIGKRRFIKITIRG